ncbi:MAG: glycosyltransferase family 1 protein [Proteobacteria bacterium]|nr:glycosyltransferase family 1 protein [Pseudomonadota bacterium]
MHITNIMLSTGSGGIEQAFLDYCDGLMRRGHRVSVITHPQAEVNASLRFLGIRPHFLRNMGEWDLLAKWRLKRKLRKLKPDVVIAQTGRAFALARMGTRSFCPLVGVAHNYNQRARRFVHADGVLAITHDVIAFVAGKGVAEDKIFHIPNMVKCDALPVRTQVNRVPVIGSMGRMVAKKGFDVFIESLRILKEQGYQFSAVLGGSGPEERALKKQAKAAGLEETLQFTGWVEDKQSFYTGLDIFCLPSRHEPFGIVLLEAFTYGTAVVSTATEGPRDIITPNFDALLANPDNAQNLADALAHALDDAGLRAQLAANAFVKAKTTYSMQSVSERIEAALMRVISTWKREYGR